MGVVEKLLKGNDGTTRGVKLRTASGKLERPPQLLYPVELRVYRKKEVPAEQLKTKAEELQPRRERKSKTAATQGLKRLVENEQI